MAFNFFNKSKNDKMKKDIINQIKKLKENRQVPISSLDKLENALRALEGTNIPATKEATEVLQDVSARFADIVSDFYTGSYESAFSKLDRAVERIGDVVKIPGGKKGPQYTPEEIFEHMLHKLQGQYDKYTDDIAKTEKELTKKPGNIPLLTKLKALQLKITNVQKKLQLYSDSTIQEELVKAAGSLESEYRDILTKQSCSDEELEYVMDRFKELDETLNGRHTTIAGYTDEFVGSMQTGSATTSQTPITQTPTTHQPQITQKPITQAPVAQPTAQTPVMAGQFSPENIDNTISDAKLARNNYMKLIAQCGERSNDCIENLKELLTVRKEASEAERLVLDPQIKMLQNEFELARRKMARYTQELDKINGMLKVAEGYKNELDISATGSELGISINLDELKNLAVTVSEMVESSNNEWEEIETAAEVAEYPEIDLAGVNDAPEYLNRNTDDAFASLEKVLGMRQ